MSVKNSTPPFYLVCSAFTLFVLSLGANLAVSAAAVPQYAAPRVYSGVGISGGQAVADFNADGRPDFIVSDSLNGNLRVFLGRTDGELQTPAITIPGVMEAGLITVADFNNDGKKDIAVIADDVLGNGDGVYVMLGNGNGTFGLRTPYVTGFSPRVILSDDFNGDGNRDFVVFDNFDNNLKIYLGDGFGGHALSSTITSINNLYATGDFNGDNRPEIIARRTVSSPLTMLANNGDGTFSAPTSISTGAMSSPSAVIAGHFNADSNLDLYAISNFSNNNMVPLLGNGNNTFTAGAVASSGTTLRSLATGDFNRDQKADLAFSDSTGRLMVFPGLGNGTFSAPVIYGSGTSSGIVADFNDDGWPDLIATVFREVGAHTSFTILINNGGTFWIAPSYAFGYAVRDIATGLVNADQFNDVITVSSPPVGPGHLIFGLSNAAGQITSQSSRSLAMVPVTLAFEDFNNDGLKDVVVGGYGDTSPQNFAFVPGTGTGLGATVLSQIGSGISELAAADINSDGNKDVVFVAGFDFMTALGNGDGTFAAPVVYPLGAHTLSLASGDFNNDGKIDFATAKSQTAEVVTLINNGTGIFTVGPSLVTGVIQNDLEAADIDGDSKVDLVGGTGDSGLYVFKGNGNGTFRAPIAMAAEHGSLSQISLRDLNQDGRIDVAASSYQAGAFVALNDGSGNFLDERVWGTVKGPLSLAVDDINGDGRPDILAGSIEPGSMSVLVHLGNATTPSAPYDFDGDGKTDIAVFRPSLGQWWINRSSNASTFAAQFGASTDTIVPADYTGDAKADIALWRPSTGEWFVLRSEDFSFYSAPFGTSGDVPTPADYDNDGKADLAVFRPASGTWFISRSGGGSTIANFGTAGDIPVAADYDGDGRTDMAIFRPSTGEWWLGRSTMGVIVAQFGSSTDRLVPGDYTGDGKSDVAFWRPSTGEWYVLRSEDFSYFAAPFGLSSDIPAPGDYDGDGKFDVTLFRPSNATWYSQRTSAGSLIQQFGASGDQPAANALVR